MPPPFAEQDKIQKTLDRIGRNDVTLSFVDWSCAEVDDEYLEKLGTALKGNTFVRKVHLNFNPAVTDAGAAALEAALPGCNVVAVWADNTGASEAARARLHLLCVTNAVRLIATNDEHLTSINWNLVGVPDEGFDTAPLVAASRAAEPQWSVEGAPIQAKVPPWHAESCDTAVAGALADALATNTNVVHISLMTNRELSSTAAAYLQAAFGRSSVQTRQLTYLPTEAREAREQAVVDARKAVERAVREKEEQEQAEAEAAKKKKGGFKPVKPKGAKKPGSGTGRVPSR